MGRSRLFRNISVVLFAICVQNALSTNVIKRAVCVACCGSFECENNGVCGTSANGTAYCNCSSPYTGPSCEYKCDKNQQFICPEKCIPLSQVCDSHVDCPISGLDENVATCQTELCQQKYCSPLTTCRLVSPGYTACCDSDDDPVCQNTANCDKMSQFSCQHKCIPYSKVCNSVADCPNGEDEDANHCEQQLCNSFHCASPSTCELTGPGQKTCCNSTSTSPACVNYKKLCPNLQLYGTLYDKNLNAVHYSIHLMHQRQGQCFQLPCPIDNTRIYNICCTEDLTWQFDKFIAECLGLGVITKAPSTTPTTKTPTTPTTATSKTATPTTATSKTATPTTTAQTTATRTTVKAIVPSAMVTTSTTSKPSTEITKMSTTLLLLTTTPLTAESEAKEILRGLNNTIFNTTAEVEKATGYLQNVTKDESILDSALVDLSVGVMTKILSDSANYVASETIVSNLLSTTDNLMDVSSEVLHQSESDSGSISNLLESMENFSSAVGIYGQHAQVVLSRGNVSLAVMRKSDVAGGVKFESNKDVASNVMLYKNTTNSSKVSSDFNSVIFIPISAIANSDTTVTSSLQFILYKSPKFFDSINDSGGSVREKGVVTRVNSEVIGANLGPTEVINLKEPVIITLRHLQTGNWSNPQCVFWNYSLSSWSSNGCSIISNTTPGVTQCQCTHLTNFALLMDIYQTGDNISPANQVALAVMSYIGCGISLAGLFATIFTYAFFRNRLKDNASTILLNLAVALFGLVLFFIFATFEFVRGNHIACSVIAGFLHYFLLAAWTWMAIEAYHLYMALIKVFNTYYSNFALKCAAIGWGIPAIPVIITAAVTSSSYGSHGNLCWLSSLPFYCACLAPILLILVINFISFVLAIHKLRAVNQNKIERSMKVSTATRVRGIISLSVLLGLTWIFAVFAVGHAAIVFHYIFAIVNSLQGFFLFLFYCVLKPDVRKAWCSIRKQRPSSSTTTRSTRSTYTDSKRTNSGSFDNPGFT